MVCSHAIYIINVHYAQSTPVSLPHLACLTDISCYVALNLGCIKFSENQLCYHYSFITACTPVDLKASQLFLVIHDTRILLTVLSSETRPHLFLATLPTLPHISQAFPPLCEDIVLLLLQLGRVCTSYLTGIANIAGTGEAMLSLTVDRFLRLGIVIQWNLTNCSIYSMFLIFTCT